MGDKPDMDSSLKEEFDQYGKEQREWRKIIARSKIQQNAKLFDLVNNILLGLIIALFLAQLTFRPMGDFFSLELGLFLVSDAVKPQAKEAVTALHKMGIKVVMLTGDDENAARYIASLVGVDEVVAQVMPEDKLNKIKALQAEGHVVAMAGDGVNDAPALAQADVGIAMATGTDVAIESAGITLLHGDISKLVKAVRLSKMTMRGIRQNLFWAFIYNIVGIPLAAGLFYPIFGWLLNPIFAGMAMAFSSVSVVGNSLRLKTKTL